MNSEANVKTRAFTCIVCPNGCDLEAAYTENEDGSVHVLSVSGNTCRKGEEYASQELVDPKRTIASSVMVRSGEAPLASVRLNRAIPKKEIFHVMDEIRKARIDAPVKAGQVVIENVLGLGSDVIITRDVDKAI